jgi:predicted nicotinamide N-methyase
LSAPGRGERSAATQAEIAAFIVANVPVGPVPSIPEILLHRADAKSGMRRLAERDPSFSSPYWAHHWAGGLALARYVLDRPDTVAGRRVLDLGAGSGLAAIAAAKAGARRAIAADVDRYAIAATELNAALNNVAIETRMGDLTEGAPPDVDVVLVGDLFYDAALASRVAAFLDQCIKAGVEVFVGDPWRAPLPRERLRLVQEYSVLDFGERAALRPAGVFVFV